MIKGPEESLSGKEQVGLHGKCAPESRDPLPREKPAFFLLVFIQLNLLSTAVCQKLDQRIDLGANRAQTLGVSSCSILEGRPTVPWEDMGRASREICWKRVIMNRCLVGRNRKITSQT